MMRVAVAELKREDTVPTTFLMISRGWPAVSSLTSLKPLSVARARGEKNKNILPSTAVLTDCGAVIHKRKMRGERLVGRFERDALILATEFIHCPSNFLSPSVSLAPQSSSQMSRLKQELARTHQQP